MCVSWRDIDAANACIPLMEPGGWAEVSDSGWMNSDLFLQWLHCFIKFSRSSKESPVLLILDGHSTHTKSLEVIDLARGNGVILLCLPPHTSTRLHPLDVTFFKPLSLYYGEELRKWLHCNPGKVVTLWQISSLFGAAFIQAATMRTALSGFEKTGIWPPNKNIFPESYYLLSDTTDNPMQALPSEPEQMPGVQDANRSDETEGLHSNLHIMPSVNDDRQYGGNAQTIENSESYRPQVDEQQPSCSFWKVSMPSSILKPYCTIKRNII